jgi:hypothetical protein
MVTDKTYVDERYRRLPVMIVRSPVKTRTETDFVGGRLHAIASTNVTSDSLVSTHAVPVRWQKQLLSYQRTMMIGLTNDDSRTWLFTGKTSEVTRVFMGGLRPIAKSLAEHWM